jgi:hypothetical protein
MTHEKEILDPETGELKQVNANFMQLYDDQLDLIMLMTKENPTALSVFLWVSKFMDERNALVASQMAIAEALGLHKNTVYLAIKYLKEKKALTILRSSNSNVFAVNAHIVWRESADAKKFAHFNAKVYITEFEQQEDKTQKEKVLYRKQLIAHAIPTSTKAPRKVRTSTKNEFDTPEKAPSTPKKAEKQTRTKGKKAVDLQTV